MTPTKLLIGQIAVVFAIVILGVWTSTQWCAHMLGYQSPLGVPWFVAAGWPIYKPWKLFEWCLHHLQSAAEGVRATLARLRSASSNKICTHRWKVPCKP
ncbi:hypothetical protein [Mesorhizobium captivum]|uniref:hypothetical protein n=1 Tax=Mesorhizobium captivum TaxID=3072319 RepID=UPI003D30F98F